MENIPDAYRIKGVYGVEPRREDEYPMGYTVGYDGVTLIEWELQNYGQYGVGCYNVFKGDELHATVLHQALAEIQYFPKSEKVDETA
jgi:hypothetical protein